MRERGHRRRGLPQASTTGVDTLNLLLLAGEDVDHCDAVALDPLSAVSGDRTTPSWRRRLVSKCSVLGSMPAPTIMG
jgi:hypothetical protein